MLVALGAVFFFFFFSSLLASSFVFHAFAFPQQARDGSMNIDWSKKRAEVD